MCSTVPSLAIWVKNCSKVLAELSMAAEIEAPDTCATMASHMPPSISSTLTFAGPLCRVAYCFATAAMFAAGTAESA